ncbi:FkbM family methyltransferase [Roseomonas sp. CAU 1739]|uniref:FkbM family methyltransferase n=1 Tax=Roseomonas sp. CAU 1739 TaxID=3140364 RepID=UPI00325AC7A5
MSDDLAASFKAMNRKLEDLRVATLYQALGPERILEFPVFDTTFRMYLPYATTDMVQRHILASASLFEQALLRRVQPHIAPGSVIVDAGANIGNHTLFFGLVCGAAEIHAFEPLRTIFAILERNVALNRLANVHCHNAALGAQEGRGSLAAFGVGNIAASRFDLDAGSGYRVTTIDALCLERLDFLKIDVEGNQIPMLQGARATIRRLRPMVWIELRPRQGEYESGDAAMRDLGYRQVETLSPTDFLYVAG